MNTLDVVALGGNAILPVGKSGTIAEQVAITRTAMTEIEGLVDAGRQIVITHGNGPIVGNIVVRNEAMKSTIPPMPLDVCGADSQGGIGYMIQQTLRNVLREKGRHDEVVSIVTQVVVDEKDPAFDNSLKPIGPYYSKDEAAKLTKERGWKIVSDSRRGYRRVVPSPYPVQIVEIEVIRNLLRTGTIVVAVGGGGIPVVVRNGRYEGVEAVIDKDLASSLLARQLGASRLIIITSVDAVYVDFGHPNARPLGVVTLDEIRHHHREGHFPAGSMGSKIQAAIEFLESGGESVVITRPGDLLEAVQGRRGTTVRRRPADGD
ncbi:MAG: carbamate kinase [Candidatus Krumholzibacteriota bacterium]|nr:carbamate kinase [Candidatus Krumholzibacteriota bacterium]